MTIGSAVLRPQPVDSAAEKQIIAALDKAPFTRRHLIFTLAILASLFFDYGKPITISFVIPGMRAMWGLTPQQASLLPVFGLTGTIIGAVFWGYMSDRVGRRLTLLWTVAIFSLASLCGLAREYWQSLLACLVMGFGVGAEIPAVLAAEFIPARYRARTLLFLGIIGWLGGYTIAATLSAIFNSFLPVHDAWRFLWLANVLPGAMIIWMRRRILPESPRFLIHKGRVKEARAAAESLIGPIPIDDLGVLEGQPDSSPVATPVRSTFYWRTALLGIFALAVSLANFGFVIWLPTLLEKLGYTGSGSSASLAASSLIAIPALAITVPVLHRLGTRKVLIVYAVGAGLALLFLSLATADDQISRTTLILGVSAVFFFFTSIGGVLSLYGVEIFPTIWRARLSGVVSALGRVGAVSGPFLVGRWLTRGVAVNDLQLALAVLLAVGAAVLFTLRVETHGRTLEQI